MTAEINAHNSPRDSEIRRAEFELLTKDSAKRIEKLEIQVKCLRQQILAIAGNPRNWQDKKSYTEQARQYAKDRE